jgi:pimeloyl-ACP methyl ester carboxylesterase
MLEILRTSDLREQLGSIRQPTLVFAGEHDRLTPPSACEYLADHIPNAEFRLFTRAAHALFISHPEKFTLELLTFLASHP